MRRAIISTDVLPVFGRPGREFPGCLAQGVEAADEALGKSILHWLA